MESNPTTKITVQTVVNAGIKKVWECWTNPEHVMQWNNASPDWHTPKASNDLRVGGQFSYTMASRDGAMSFDFGGVYTAVEQHRLIEYALGDSRQVSVKFAEEENGVSVIETFDPEKINSHELQQAGWQAILDNFKKHCEAES